MTNREKLSKIIDDWHIYEDNFNSDEKRQLLLDIEKDLEVLEILRQKIFYDKEKDYGYADFNFSYPDFENETELRKVKEWLENDK